MDTLYNTHFYGMEWRPWTILWIKAYSLVIKLHSHTMVGCDELTPPSSENTPSIIW